MNFTDKDSLHFWNYKIILTNSSNCANFAGFALLQNNKITLHLIFALKFNKFEIIY